MPLITITLEVPEGVEVDVRTVTSKATPGPQADRRIVVQRSADLNVPSPTKSRYAVRRWSEDEDNLLRHTMHVSVHELVTMMDRTEHAIYQRRWKLGLSQSGRVRTLDEAPFAMRRWSGEEDRALLALAAPLLRQSRFKKGQLEELAATMGRSTQSIRFRLRALRNQVPQED